MADQASLIIIEWTNTVMHKIQIKELSWKTAPLAYHLLD